ncbi:MAG: hypothetical protein ACD_46C00080G0011 [uncultured bacterium]|nr:MAG: hypothetical protein ACD_46C00080G0011 [uncultured bacterium]
MDVTKYKDFAQQIMAKLMPYLEEKRPELTTHRSCIQFSPRNIAFIHLNKREDDAIELLAAETFQYDDIGNLPLILSSFVDAHHLAKVPLYWLLSFDDYQLSLLDAMPVPQNELRDALTWRLKSLISYPIEEAVIDYFMVPAKKTAPEHPMIAAITAKKDLLNKYIEVIKKSGLSITTIDIPELALRNLSAVYENDEKSTAFIYFAGKFVILNITCQKMLYFTRRIDLVAEKNENKYEKLSLEILRYFDYFQTQWRHTIPSRIFVASISDDANQIAKSFSEYLLAPVETFSLKSLFPDEKISHLIEQKFLLTFGSALKQEKQYVQTRS